MKPDNPTNQYPTGYMRVKAASQYTGIPVSTLWAYVQKGVLPPPVKVSARVTLWRKSDIDEAIENIAASAGCES